MSDHAVGTWTPDGEIAPPVTEDAVIAAISTVYDPEIPVNIYELGLIYTIELQDQPEPEPGALAPPPGKAVRVEMTLTAPGCPSAQELPVEVRDAIMALPGVASCEVDTVWEPAWDPSRMTDDARLSLNMY
jgi:FeS assembly SUF system protein